MELLQHLKWFAASLALVAGVVLVGSWWDEIEDFWKSWESGNDD